MNFSRSSLRTPGLFALIAFVPALAQAHPGHDHSGFGSGIVHPFQGLDHLLAMVAIGLWAAQLGGRARWMVPLSFVGTLTLGAVAGLAGLHLPGAEIGVAASVVMLGLLLLAAIRLPVAASAVIAGLFALCHGYVHAAEIPAGATSLGFIGGMIISTALLHALGLGAALAAQSTARPVSLRLAGAAVVVLGALTIV
jgi:urease accessory protein